MKRHLVAALDHAWDVLPALLLLALVLSGPVRMVIDF